MLCRAAPRDAGCPRGLLDPGDPEVEDLGPAVVRQEDVVGLDVAVDDAAGVRGREAVGDLGGDLDRLLGRERAASRSRSASDSPCEELRHGPGDARNVARVVDREDVRMVEGGDGPRLAVEAREAVGVVRATRPAAS